MDEAKSTMRTGKGRKGKAKVWNRDGRARGHVSRTLPGGFVLSRNRVRVKSMIRRGR